MRNLFWTLALLVPLALGLSLAAAETGPQEAPAAFDGATNGLVDAATHHADTDVFDAVEDVSDGLGPLYNAQAWRECHQNPQSGGISQVSELRVGHRDRKGRFVNPSVPIADGAAVITGRTSLMTAPSAQTPPFRTSRSRNVFLTRRLSAHSAHR